MQNLFTIPEIMNLITNNRSTIALHLRELLHTYNIPNVQRDLLYALIRDIMPTSSLDNATPTFTHNEALQYMNIIDVTWEEIDAAPEVRICENVAGGHNFAGGRIFRSLVLDHLFGGGERALHYVGNDEFPSYIRDVINGDRGNLNLPERSVLARAILHDSSIFDCNMQDDNLEQFREQITIQAEAALNRVFPQHLIDMDIEEIIDQGSLVTTTACMTLVLWNAS